MKKMFWMSAVVALLLTPVLVNAAEGDDPMAVWKARRATLMTEARGLRLALYKAKIAAKRDNADLKALGKDKRAARTAVKQAEKADKTVVAAAKAVADVRTKQRKLKSSLEALKPIAAKKKALVYPGRGATKEAKAEYMKALRALMSEERKILAANEDYKALLAEAIKVRKALKDACANSELVKAAEAKVDELTKKIDEIVMAVPAVKEAAEKLAAKQKELAELKRPAQVRGK